MNLLSFFVIDCYYYNFSLFNIFGNQGIPQNNIAEKKKWKSNSFSFNRTPIVSQKGPMK